MRYEWGEDKNEKNRSKHGVSFVTATLVFDDPYALTKPDFAHDEEEERFLTLGAIGPGAILLVVHTSLENSGGEEVIRMISARAATSREKKDYEKTHKPAKTRNRRRGEEERRRH
ncbi:MAG: BrnT family toxin [Terriglobales bacterium]